MNVYALVGESGSGKSYRAMWLAGKLGISYVIDDGLLICGARVVEGKSAKKEKTKMGSTKRAIFFEDEDAEKMRLAIKREKVKKLLILGTSNRMVDRIAERVGVGKITRYINITEIASPEEIATAKQIRKHKGMHVIPVPQVAITKDFQGYFVETLEVLLGGSMYRSEKTVVRPNYSFMGDYNVARSVICDVCKYEAARADGVLNVKYALVNSVVGIGTVVRLDLVIKYGTNVRRLAKKINAALDRAVGEYIGMPIERIEINIVDIGR